VSFFRRFDGSHHMRLEPVAPLHEDRLGRSTQIAVGTLACPRCDAPVSPGDDPLALRAPLGCPFCGEAGSVRDFLSLGMPTRPARVVVRVARR
jgi:hypothetical protein